MRTIAFPIKALLLLFVLTMSVKCLAQNLDNQLNRANQLKAEYGELDERYLNALNDVVNAASQDKKWDVALKYRQKHTDLTKKKFGENSVQYAEDLVRVANCINYSVPEGMPVPALSTIPLYENGIKIYKENSDTICYMFYMATKILAAYHEQLNDYKTANYWWNRSLNCIKKIATSDTSIENMRGLVYTYGSYLASCNRIGLFKEGKNKALEAYQFIIENNLMYRLPPDGVDLIFRGLSILWENEKDYSSKILCEEEYSVFLEKAYGSKSKAFLDNLHMLALDYTKVGSWEKSISAQYNYTLGCREINESIPFHLDTLFYSNLNLLSLFCQVSFDRLGKNLYYEVEYWADSTMKEIIERNGETTSKDYFEVIDRIGKYYLLKKRYSDYSAIKETNDRAAAETYRGYYEDYKVAMGLKLGNNSLLMTREKYLKEIEHQQSSLFAGDSVCMDLLKKMMKITYYEYVAKYDSLEYEVADCLSKIDNTPFCFSVNDSIRLLSSLHLYEATCLTQNRDTTAKEKFDLALEEMKLIGDTNRLPFLQLGLYYLNVENDYSKAKEAFVIFYNYLRNNGDTISYNFFSVINNIGLCYLNLGDLYMAISCFEYSATMGRKIYGEIHPIYANTLQNMSLYYSYTCDNVKSLQYAKETAEILKQLYGENSDNYAQGLINCGILYHSVSPTDTLCIQYLSRGIDIVKKNNGTLSPKLLTPYGELVRFMALNHDFEGAASIQKSALQIVETNNLYNTEIGANYLLSVGLYYLELGIPDARQNFGAYLGILDRLDYRTSAKYFQAYAFYTLAGFLSDTISFNNNNVEFLYSLYNLQYLKNVKFLNQKERESLLIGNEYNLYKNLIFSLHKYDSTNIKLFDFILLNKGLLLATALEYAKTIYESGDSVLIKRYEKLQSDIKKDNPTGTFSSETARIQNEEREIIFAASKLGASNYVSCNYDSIMSVIKDKDVAVEYVAYNDYNRLKEGIIEKRYAALVARKELEQPIYIPLCTSDDIEPLVNGYPNVLYNGGDVSQAILNLLWKPIEKYVHKGDEVYFSPDGCIYKLALENIQVDENVTLGTKYNMHRCSSTRQIRDRQTERKYHNAVLYGGLSYDVDEETMRNNSRSYAPSMTRGYTPAFGETEANVRRGWNYLPGTKQEIDDVSAILRKKKIVCDTYSGAKGNEESFKTMSGSNISILHIATHGFYIQEGDAEKVKIMQQPQWMQNTSMIDKALRRSGLMLAGGNKAWKSGYGIEGIEDGVLTAQEISNMNLSSVDLLVLSACETGLGDVANEGVFGLQWAFKSAGVGTIIMSLWEVDDNATALMMKIFYQELTKGKSKREAFEKAKNVVKETYVKPSQWAAFIILD